MKTSLKNTLFILAVSMVTLTACKKDETTPSNVIDGDVQTTADDRTTSSAIDDVTTILNDYAANIDPNSSGGRTEGTILGAGQTSFNISTKTLTIDFGTQNATCSDGKKRRGKIFIQFTQGSPRQLDHTTVTSQDNYYVEDIKVDGTRTDVVKVTIANNAFTNTRKITVQNRKLTFPDKTTFSESGTMELAFRGTLPNTFEGTGTVSLSGTNRKNQAFTSSTSTPLKVVSSCPGLPPVSGKIDITITSNPTEKIVIDYGNGVCDRIATITYKGITVTKNF